MGLRRALLTLACVLGLTAAASAQGTIPTVVKGVDTSTGNTTDVGDNTNHALRVNIVAGAAGGSSATDKSTFTYSSTAFTNVGGVYNSSITALTSGQAGAAALTPTRDLHASLFNPSDGTPIVFGSSAVTNTAVPTDGPLIQCYGSTAVPTAVGADGRAVPPWCDRNGRLQVTLSAGSPIEITPMASATTTNAASGCYLVSAASTNSTSCKGSAGNLYGFRMINTTSTIYYLRLYNSASAPTCSSATGFIESIPIPQASGAGAGVVAFSGPPIGYGTGIGFCFTGGSSSTDNTNAATGVFGAIYYK